MKNNKFVLMDIDGTTYADSLLMQHYLLLIQKGILPNSYLLTQWLEDKKNDDLIYECANEYKERLKTISLNLATDVAKELVSTITEKHLYQFTYRKMQEYKKMGYEIIFISGSPKFIVKEFAKKFNAKGYGSIYEVDNKNLFTGNVMGMWGADHKAYLINFLGLNTKDVIAFGDSTGDFGMFEFAKQSYFIHPNKENIEKSKKYKNVIIIK